MRRYAPLLLLLTPSAFAVGKSSGGRLELHDPTFYKMLEAGTSLDCRYLRNDQFGFRLERGLGDEVRVSLITNGESEGARSAFTARITENAWDGISVQHRQRDGAVARHFEFHVLNRVSAEAGYRMPGSVLMLTKTYAYGAEGKEQETVYLDGSFRLACRIR